MPITLQALIKYITDLVTGHFYGEAHIRFFDGKIIIIKEEKTMTKLEEM